MSLNLNNSNDIICNTFHIIENGNLVSLDQKIASGSASADINSIINDNTSWSGRNNRYADITLQILWIKDPRVRVPAARRWTSKLRDYIRLSSSGKPRSSIANPATKTIQNSCVKGNNL